MKSVIMRKVLFTLVFFFIQYVSCVVVSSCVKKALNEILIVATEKSQINSSSLDKSNKIDEKEIFENGDDKPNNLSERSFVWINTRFKSPLRSKIYNSKIDEWKLGRLYPLKKSQHNVMNLIQRQLPPLPKPTISLMARNPSSFSPRQSSPKPPTPTAGPPLFRPHYDIKIPCTMTNKYSDKETRIKCNQGFSKPFIYDKFRQELPKMVPHLNNIVNDVIPELVPKRYEERPKKPHILNSVTRSKVKETYGFPGLYQLHRSAFSTNELSYRPEEINQEGNLFTDDNFVLSPVDDSDEDKLLERYIKHTLADNGVHVLDHDLHSKCKECNNGRSNPDCKCETDAPEVKSKLYQFIEKKIKQIDLETTTESNNKVSEDGDSSNDETFSNKTMVDVLLTPNTINDLLH